MCNAASRCTGRWRGWGYRVVKLASVTDLPATLPVGEVAAAAGPDRAPSPTPSDDTRRLEQIDAELTGVEAALRRLDDGSYGTCEVCAAPLDAAVLAAAPTTRCAQHHR